MGACASCMQILGGDPDNAEDKKRTIPLREVECLAYSFKSIAKIDNLNGLDSLVKLQLDNNQIAKIENIGHLVCSEAIWHPVRSRGAGSLHLMRSRGVCAGKAQCSAVPCLAPFLPVTMLRLVDIWPLHLGLRPDSLRRT